MWVNEQQYRKEIIEVGKRLYQKGLLVSTDGNISIRIAENEILITSSGFCKGTLTPEQITKVDMAGNIISGLKPARDIRMHLSTYKCRPNVKAIVHAHPPITTGFAMTDQTFSKVALPEVLFTMGKIGVTDFALATTEEVPMVVEKTLQQDPDYGAIILASHGALTFGNDVWEAFYKMETMEMFLTATLVSKLLGNVNYLSKVQEGQIWNLIKGGSSTQNSACSGCGNCAGKNGEKSVQSVQGGQNIKTVQKEQGSSGQDMEAVIQKVVEEVIKNLIK